MDLLYLDAGDYDGMNPAVSQQLMLKEVKAAQGKLHKETVIVMDDCDLYSGGKCQMAADYLVCDELVMSMHAPLEFRCLTLLSNSHDQRN